VDWLGRTPMGKSEYTYDFVVGDFATEQLVAKRVT
jgi:hypothetical protein